jgi:hypothetical protein
VPLIRLLTRAADDIVAGDVGEVLEVDARTASTWADGIRAERVIDRGVQHERAVGRPAR